MSDYLMTLGSGVQVNMLEPDPATLLIEDIAHNLAGEGRYVNSIQRRYSVAAHSIVVCQLAIGLALGCDCRFPGSPTCPHVGERVGGRVGSDGFLSLAFVARTALFHDAPEAYLRDLPLDAKAAMRAVHGSSSPYDVLDGRFMHALTSRYHLDPRDDVQALVKDADCMALSAEVQVLWPEHLRHRFAGPRASAAAIAFVSHMVASFYTEGQIEYAFLRAAAGVAYGYSPGCLPWPSA